jgi:hypothetical protein
MMDANGKLSKIDRRDTRSSFKRFIKRSRASIQGFALLLALVMPFLLYVALQNGDNILAAAAFSLIVFSMLLVILV